jgi:hypothetical protein
VIVFPKPGGPRRGDRFDPVVSAFAVVAAAVATMFAQATSVRFHQHRRPQEAAWTVALFALASVALFLGDSTGWDNGTYRAFYLFGAILNVPWLALGTVYLLAPRPTADRVRTVLVFGSGLAAGTLLAAPIHGDFALGRIPEGKEHFDALPRVLAGAGSGIAALVIFAGAAISALRWARRRGETGAGRLAVANTCIALGTVIVSSGGLLKGWLSIDADEAFAVCTAAGISVIYAGFWIAASRTESRSARRRTLPANV